jgi:hypothetical protein
MVVAKGSGQSTRIIQTMLSHDLSGATPELHSIKDPTTASTEEQAIGLE